jgi:hypothetical protein
MMRQVYKISSYFLVIVLTLAPVQYAVAGAMNNAHGGHDQTAVDASIDSGQLATAAPEPVLSSASGVDSHDNHCVDLSHCCAAVLSSTPLIDHPRSSRRFVLVPSFMSVVLPSEKEPPIAI